MAIESTDIKFMLSVTTGSAGNSTAGTPAGSRGKYVSTSEYTSGTANNVFDDVSGDENAASDVEYRCVFVRNAHSTLTLTGATVWISAEVTGGAVAAIAVDSTAASAIGSASAQALVVADESTAPAALSFTAPTTKAGGLSVGDIPAGYCRGIWVRRTAQNSAALNADGVTLRVEGDTAA